MKHANAFRWIIVSAVLAASFFAIVAQNERSVGLPSLYSCNVLDGDQERLTFRYRFDVEATAANGATIEKYEFDFGDYSIPLDSTSSSVVHEYQSWGSYHVSVKVHVRLPNGDVEEVTSQGCQERFMVYPPGA